MIKEKQHMSLLITGAKEMGLTLTDRHLEAFLTCYQELVDWNQRFNLTAITGWEKVLTHHFLDSLSCLKALPREELAAGARVIDVGTGAGFPGLPLKLVCPEVQMTLLEATNKKVAFVQHIARKLKLREIEVIHGRAEELGRDPTYREQYDWAMARAVAKMPVLVEYLLPMVRMGGAILAQKGEDAAAEVHAAEAAIVTLGGRVQQLIPVKLRGLAETRYLVVIDKVAATPEKYPRRPGMPKKYPLR